MVERTQFRCMLCGVPRWPSMLRLDADTGAFIGPAHEPHAIVFTYGGRNSLSTAQHPLPMEFALGIRDALRAALERIEGDIVEAGGELAP